MTLFSAIFLTSLLNIVFSPLALQLEFHELPNELPKRFLGIPELPFPDILFGKWPTKPRTFLMAVRMLPFYLLRSPYHKPLARSLRHYTLDMHSSWKDKVEFDYAVREYVSVSGLAIFMFLAFNCIDHCSQ